MARLGAVQNRMLRHGLTLSIVILATALASPPRAVWAQPQTLAVQDSTEPSDGAAGWPPWLHALAKTATYETLASVDVFLFGTWWTGNQTIGGGFALASAATAALAFYMHERVWTRWGPDPNTAVPEELGLFKTITYRIVSAVRLITMTYLLTGSALVSGAYVAANTVVDSIIYYGNDLAWSYYGPPIRQPPP